MAVSEVIDIMAANSKTMIALETGAGAGSSFEQGFSPVS
jgi:hypothetical protein